jgi:flagellin-specific chaperone FliS
MKNPHLVYQRQAVKDASPIQIVVKMYDLIIQASYREDGERVRELLSTLIRGLNFDHEPAGELFSLYQYCQGLSRKNEYEEIRELLEPLRDAWEQLAVAPKQN